MQSIDPSDTREAEAVKIVLSKEDTAALQQHLAEIIQGAEFKGSPRCGQFLRYVVEQTIAGHFDSLKERVIGTEVFGRSPSYETGEDAIVRVTAYDVRKRLAKHYERYRQTSGFRLSLPSGSYIPSITRVDGLVHDGRADPQSAIEPEPAAVLSTNLSKIQSTNDSKPLMLIVGFLFTVVNLTVWGIFWMHSARKQVAPVAAISALPWSAIFSSPHSTQIITSDPDMAEIERFTGGYISVSDYASRNYLSGPRKLTPEEEKFCRSILIGDKAALADTQAIANVAELAQANSRRIDVHGARDTQLSDLRTDDSFIFMGSPSSDPWTELFGDQLDFWFDYDKVSKIEVIRNVHPHPNEQPIYVPTSLGSATRESFAIVAFIQNPDQDGQVLLLAGADREGTEAAGRLATDPTRLSPILQNCGVHSSGPVQHFELLLHLKAIDRSPSEFDVVACHLLRGISSQQP